MAESERTQDALRTAVDHHRAGRLSEAESVYRRVLEAHPDHPDALHLLGVLVHQAGRPERAADLIGRAVAKAPGRPVYLTSLANAHLALGRAAEAMEGYRRALAIDPDFLDAHLNLGKTLAGADDPEGAAACFRRALALDPRLVAAHVNLGAVLRKLGQTDQAIDHLRRALTLDPDDADAHTLLGTALGDQWQWRDAAACCRRALEIDPGHAEAFNVLGLVWMLAGHPARAVECHRKAVAAAPRSATYAYHLGLSSGLAGATDESVAALRRAVDLDQDHAGATALLAHQLQHACEWSQLESLKARARDQTRAALAAGRRPGEMPMINLLLNEDPAENRAVAAAWSRTVTAAVASWQGTLPPRPPPSGDPRITIGYLSHDFRDHAIGHQIGGVIEGHDRDRFRVLAYSTGPDDGSAYRRRIEGSCESFNDIARLAPPEAARRIRLDGVDILVDLMGHTKGNRLEICALRPAPVQAHYLGFPGTSGSDFIDYLITDPVVTPPGHAAHFSEKFATLPPPSLVPDRGQPIAERPASRTEAGLPEHGVVFCGFNQVYKIEPVIFDVWMEVLRAVEGSVLWLFANDPVVEANLRREASARGMDPARLVFADRVPKDRHLARIGLADLALDTRIYHGHITTCDILWAGVPVVAVAGERHVSRLSAGVLTAAGLPELITTDLDRYRDLAIGLARAPDRLRRLKDRLAATRTTAPLFDPPRFVANLERVYEAMWDVHLSGAPPRPVAVD